MHGQAELMILIIGVIVIAVFLFFVLIVSGDLRKTETTFAGKAILGLGFFLLIVMYAFRDFVHLKVEPDFTAADCTLVQYLIMTRVECGARVSMTAYAVILCGIMFIYLGPKLINWRDKQT